METFQIRKRRRVTLVLHRRRDDGKPHRFGSQLSAAEPELLSTSMVLSDDGLVSRTFTAAEVLRLVLAGSEDANAGRWFSTASTETRSKLAEAYALEPYPSDQQMDKLARALKAPSKACVRTFYQSMHLKAMELCGHG